jgi:hypothetical protein
MPERSAMAPKPCTPAYFGAFLARSWAEGTTKVRHLFSDIRHRGDAGSCSHLARVLAPWRSRGALADGDDGVAADQEAPAPLSPHVLDPTTGRRISPLAAAAFCIKPRRQMTARQVVNVDALKADFRAMRRLAMRFRGLLRGGTVEKLDAWLKDAHRSGVYGMQRFARALRHDIEAVRNAVPATWSNGQTEGQINRPKTRKRAMYGRAGVDLLRARLMPLQNRVLHQKWIRVAIQVLTHFWCRVLVARPTKSLKHRDVLPIARQLRNRHEMGRCCRTRPRLQWHAPRTDPSFAPKVNQSL